MIVMRTVKTFFLSAVALSFAGCTGVVPDVTSLDFGDIYIVGSYPGSTPLENSSSMPHTITGVQAVAEIAGDEILGTDAGGLPPEILAGLDHVDAIQDRHRRRRFHHSPHRPL